ncbi:hypothetical protein M404DRAFT_30338 [Pisolithus tinctorius Marx 270]|uniref:Uncharacterized protein n=1 Tax=Pisolithus tinctorius Marx 270 TaxID=870435 RepID=A0A0C3IRX0_PISTI|nr:hypothetical protein M404DRAFT_30338 [Pisolithus tinctorius Marx 270]
MQDIVNEDDCSVSLLAVPSNTPSDNEDHCKQSVPPSTTPDAHLCCGLQSVSNDEDDCEQSVPPNIPSDAHLSHALQNMSSDEDDHEQSCHPPCTPQKVSYNDQSMESEEDEQAVAVVMHSEDPADFGEVYHPSNVDHQPSDNSDDEHSDSDWSTTVRYNLKCQQTAREIRAGNYDLDTHLSTPPLDFPSSEDTADTEGTVDTEDTGELRKCKGKSTHILPKVSRCSESNEDGFAAENGPLTLRHGRLPINALQKAQALGVHTTHQACGNDEAACQAQGVFAGSLLCMQLASKRQTDVAKLLDFLSMIIKYKILDSAASIPLPNFALLSQKSYDHALALQSQEKFHKSLQLSLSDLLAEAPQMKPRSSHTIVDWPAGVPAVGPDFNVKCLNADKLHALTVPFLKEQMEQDYNLEAPAEEEEDHFVPAPASLFYLKHWTAGEHN